MSILKKINITVIIIAILFLGFSGLSIFYFLETSNEISKLEKNLELNQKNYKILEEKLIASNNKIKDQKRAIKEEAKKIFEKQKKIESRKIKSTKPEIKLDGKFVSNKWLILESEYLLQLASDRLILSQDIKAAKDALKSADQKLKKTNDRLWDQVRSQIAFDIQMLNATRLPDKIGISSKISALNSQIINLPLKYASNRNIKKEERRKTERHLERTWNNLLENILLGLKNTVRIRRRDEPITEILPPGQQYFIYENLRIYLESSRMAMIRSDNKMFQENLKKAYSWLTKHFDTSDPLTISTVESVNDLIKINISPTMPNISKSLSLIKKLKAEKENLSSSLPNKNQKSNKE
tara:strand:- start:1632 stop:2687 length:1056 start_codon:yes stop_codon:yes gene_type:complete